MNFTSLPDEMIYSVAKYLPFAALVRVRKQSYQLDRIVKHFRLNRTPVFSLRVEKLEDTSDYYIHIVLNEYQRKLWNCAKHQVTSEKHLDYDSLLFTLDKVLKRVKVASRLSMWRINFNNEFANFLKKNRKTLRNCKNLSFNSVTFDCDEITLKTTLHSFSKGGRLQVEGDTSMQKILNTEVLDGCKLSTICAYLSETDPNEGNQMDIYKLPYMCSLNDEFLEKVVRNCSLYNSPICRTNFSIGSIIRIVESIDMDPENSKKWHLGIVHSQNMSIELIKNLLEERISKGLVIQFTNSTKPTFCTLSKADGINIGFSLI